MDSLGFTLVHLSSLGFTWVYLGSLGFPWVYFGSLGISYVHLGCLEFTWVHLGSLGFTWVHLGVWSYYQWLTYEAFLTRIQTNFLYLEILTDLTRSSESDGRSDVTDRFRLP